MAEVEAQPVGRDQRTRLLHVRAEHLAQRPVQHVRRGVVAADAVASHRVDRGHPPRRPREALPLAHDALVHDHRTRHSVLGVAHVEHRAAGDNADRAGIADLSTRLRVERCAIEHDLDRGALAGFVDAAVGVTSASTVAFVSCSWRPVNSVAPSSSSSSRQTGRSPAAAPASSAAARARARCSAMRRSKSSSVDAATAFARDLPGEVDREAERVVQEEGVLAAHVAPVDHAVEQVDTALQRGAERLLLRARRPCARRRRLSATISGYAAPMTSTAASIISGSTRSRAPSRYAWQHRATDDAPQHVAALVVRRPHAVGDDERHRARVLGDDAQRHVDRFVVAVARAGRALGFRDQRPEHVDVPDRRLALHDQQIAFEPGAGVDARLRQRHARAVGAAGRTVMNTRFQISM